MLGRFSLGSEAHGQLDQKCNFLSSFFHLSTKCLIYQQETHDHDISFIEGIMSTSFRVMASAATAHKIYPVADKWLQAAAIKQERGFDHLFMNQYLDLSLTKAEHTVESSAQFLILDNMIQHVRFHSVIRPFSFFLLIYYLQT